MPFTFGLISIVKNSLKLAWGCMEWSFFSSCINHPGARWTFSSITHLPDQNIQGVSKTRQNLHVCNIKKQEQQQQKPNITHLPDLTAVLMSLSALLKPSAEPVSSEQTQTSITKRQTWSHLCVRSISRLLSYQLRWRWFVCSAQQQDLWPGRWHHNLVQNTWGLECWASPTQRTMSATGSTALTTANASNG